MGEINFALLQPVDTGAQVMQGFQTGMAMVKQVQTKHALSNYLTNPDDPGAYNALAYYDPGTASAIEEHRSRQRKEALELKTVAQRQQIGAIGASDPAAASVEAARTGDPELAKQWAALGEDQRKAATSRAEAAGPLAYQASKLPYERRREFIEANRDLLKAGGWKDEEIDAFDPQDAKLAGLIGNSMKVSELVGADKPQYIAGQPGGPLFEVKGGAARVIVAPNPGDKVTGAPVTESSGSGGSDIEGKNNPGALRKPGSTEFQTFSSRAQGIEAQHAQLNRYLGRGLNTIPAIIETYAPRESRGGDNTDAQVNNYIAYVAQHTGIDPSQPITPAQIPVVAKAMREFETGHKERVAGVHDAAAIRAAAQRAIANGADPAKVRERAAAQGVQI